jgi:hypothetical protein
MEIIKWWWHLFWGLRWCIYVIHLLSDDLSHFGWQILLIFTAQKLWFIVTGEIQILATSDWHVYVIILNIPSIIQWTAGHVARMAEGRNVYRGLVGKPEGKRLLGRQRRWWKDGIKMDLREIGLECVKWIHLAQDRDRWRAVVNAVMNLWVLAPRSWLIQWTY